MSSEFISTYISEDEEDRFKRLVLKDVRGRATEEEIQELSQERQLWLDELILVVTDIQNQITERNVALTKHMPWDEYNRVKGEIQSWKVSALRFKERCLDRRRDVKAARKVEADEENEERQKVKREREANAEANPRIDWGPVLVEIRDELRAIRTAMEA